MKKFKILIIFSFLLVLCSCQVDISPDKKELEKVDLKATVSYDDSKVSQDIKDIVDENFNPDKTIKLGENPPFELDISSNAQVKSEVGNNDLAIGVNFTNKVEKFSFSISIFPVSNDFNPKAFYLFYSSNYKVDIVDIEGMELVLSSPDNQEFIGQFIGKDKKYYVVTIKSKFNIHENIYVMNKINQNLRR